MSDRCIAPGDKLHIMTRRLFADDLRRHFVGEVVNDGDGMCVIKGYTYVFNPSSNKYQKRDQLRTRVFSLMDVGHIVNKFPPEVVIQSLEYCIVGGRLVVTDMKDCLLDINEFGPTY